MGSYWGFLNSRKNIYIYGPSIKYNCNSSIENLKQGISVQTVLSCDFLVWKLRFAFRIFFIRKKYADDFIYFYTLHYFIYILNYWHSWIISNAFIIYYALRFSYKYVYNGFVFFSSTYETTKCFSRISQQFSFIYVPPLLSIYIW